MKTLRLVLFGSALRALLPMTPAPSALAEPALRERPVSAAIDAELEYLLGFVGPRGADPGSLSLQRIERTVSFVSDSKPLDVMHYAQTRRGAPSAYYEIDLRRPLQDVLRLTYDSEVPAVVTAPSTVRVAHWNQVDSQTLERLWSRTPASQAPLSITGVERIVNTPDEHTGAYYAYKLNRTLFLIPWRGRDLFISLSAQDGTSSVGWRGVILGPDSQWNYLYTGRPGLDWPGLGWVRSYMYDSYSAAFYLGAGDAGTAVRFAVFKWLRAGWSGLNMVKSAHIHDGLRRFGTAYKAILEDPRTADTAAVTEQFRMLQRIPTTRMRQLAEAYFQALQAQISSREARAILTDGNHLASLERDELLALISLERLKALLGKPHLLDPKLIEATAGGNR